MTGCGAEWGRRHCGGWRLSEQSDKGSAGIPADLLVWVTTDAGGDWIGEEEDGLHKHPLVYIAWLGQQEGVR